MCLFCFLFFVLFLGDCIGPTIINSKLFPSVLSFGQEEMTGAIHCDDWLCKDILGLKYSKFSTNIYSEKPGDIYVPRSSLHFIRTKNGHIKGSFQFLIPLKSDEIEVGIDRFEILKPNLDQQCQHWNTLISSSTLLERSIFSIDMQNSGMVSEPRHVSIVRVNLVLHVPMLL